MIAGFAPVDSPAAQPLARSVLIVAQLDSGLPWYAAVSSAFHTTLRANSPLREKYREKNIGAIVTVGPLALEFMLGTRLELWSAVPLVFSTVDEPTVAQLKLPPDVTGSTIQLNLRDMVAMARVLVPNLQRFALVGEPLEGTSVYRNFKQELPLFTVGLEFIDLTGLPMTEVKKRVAALPENTAILYTAIFIDGASPVMVCSPCGIPLGMPGGPNCRKNFSIGEPGSNGMTFSSSPL